jgi:hypothetical protein
MKGFSYVVDSIAKPELQPTMLPFWHWLLDNLCIDIFACRFCFRKLKKFLQGDGFVSCNRHGFRILLFKRRVFSLPICDGRYANRRRLRINDTSDEEE